MTHYPHVHTKNAQRMLSTGFVATILLYGRNPVDELVWNPGSSKLTPPKKPKNRTPPNDREAAVLKECLIFLATLDSVAYVERRNTGSVEFEGGGHIGFGRKGAADIWCLVRVYGHHTPMHIEIECKRRDGKGKLSRAQLEFQRDCENRDIPYFVVTSATELAEKLLESGLTI